MLGVALTLLSALSFSMNSVMARRGLARAAASAGSFITVLLGVPLFFLAALVTGELFEAGRIPLNGYVLLGLAGISHFCIGRYFNYRAQAAIGATRAQTVQALNVPYSVGVAWLTLNEEITPLMLMAIALIVIGPVIMVQRGQPKPRAVPAGGSTAAVETFQLKQVEGYLSALMTVFAYGTSPIFIRAALDDITGVSIYGGFVSYLVAALVLMATLVLPGRRGLIRAMNFSTVRLFLGAGTMVFLAQMFRFMALGVAPVSVVAPLMQTSAIFTLVLSYTVNRKLEIINLRVVAGILLSMTGAIILALVGVGR
jgi:drug/metabolite transporter (DMT)-like permease